MKGKGASLGERVHTHANRVDVRPWAQSPLEKMSGGQQVIGQIATLPRVSSPWSWRTVVHQGAGEKRFSVASPFLRAPTHQARSGRSPITGIFVDGTSSPSHR